MPAPRRVRLQALRGLRRTWCSMWGALPAKCPTSPRCPGDRYAPTMRKPIRYAQNGDVHIAYQVVGDGPLDLVYTSGIWSNLEIMWEWSAWARYLERLASFSRLIL